MKHIFVLVAAGLAIFIAGSATAQKYEMGQIFVGQILNRACAHAVAHSPGATQTEANKPGECTERSAHPYYVFYDPETKTTCELADQEKFAEFAGQTVRLVGYVNNSSRAIEVSEITRIP